MTTTSLRNSFSGHVHKTRSFLKHAFYAAAPGVLGFMAQRLGAPVEAVGGVTLVSLIAASPYLIHTRNSGHTAVLPGACGVVLGASPTGMGDINFDIATMGATGAAVGCGGVYAYSGGSPYAASGAAMGTLVSGLLTYVAPRLS